MYITNKRLVWEHIQKSKINKKNTQEINGQMNRKSEMRTPEWLKNIWKDDKH